MRAGAVHASVRISAWLPSLATAGANASEYATMPPCVPPEVGELRRLHTFHQHSLPLISPQPGVLQRFLGALSVRRMLRVAMANFPSLPVRERRRPDRSFPVAFRGGAWAGPGSDPPMRGRASRSTVFPASASLKRSLVRERNIPDGALLPDLSVEVARRAEHQVHLAPPCPS